MREGAEVRPAGRGEEPRKRDITPLEGCPEPRLLIARRADPGLSTRKR